MATEADWLKLKLSDLKAALLGAGGDASGLRSKQSYAQALVALGVALPGGGGPQLLGGGAGGGGVGAVDVRSEKEQLAGCVADAELEKGLVGVLPSAFDASLPADVLGWLVASLFVVLGGPLTRSRLENGWKVDFTGPDGVRKRMRAVCMEKKSPDFVPMVDQAVAEYVRLHWALPVGVCAGDAEAAMMMVLDYLRRVEDKAGGLAQQIGGLLSNAKSTGSLAPKLSAQEWSRAAAKLQRLGYMVEKFDAPLFSQMGMRVPHLQTRKGIAPGRKWSSRCFPRTLSWPQSGCVAALTGAATWWKTRHSSGAWTRRGGRCSSLCRMGRRGRRPRHCMRLLMDTSCTS